MIVPPLLKAGDLIAIVAPSRKVEPVNLEPAKNIFKTWGLDVALSKHIYSRSHSYLSASDDERLHDLQTCVNNPDIKCIIAARGGYGSTRIIDRLDLSALTTHPKWIIGFSDITAIHLKLLRAGIMSIHGTMPILFSKSDSGSSIESLRKLLFEGNFLIQSPPHNSNRFGRNTGKLIGGNLSLIIDSLGTSSEPDTTNAILVVEEIDEYFYRVDRMMTQLRRARKLQSLKGLIVGHMTDIKESELPFKESIEQIILNAVREYNYPVVFGFPTGHENPNHAWTVGQLGELSVDDKGGRLQNKYSANA